MSRKQIVSFFKSEGLNHASNNEVIVYIMYIRRRYIR